MVSSSKMVVALAAVAALVVTTKVALSILLKLQEPAEYKDKKRLCQYVLGLKYEEGRST